MWTYTKSSIRSYKGRIVEADEEQRANRAIGEAAVVESHYFSFLERLGARRVPFWEKLELRKRWTKKLSTYVQPAS